VASAIAGNIAQESGGNPDAVNPKSGAFGIAQFLGDRKAGLFNYAKENNLFPNDLSTQLDYMMQELQGKDAGAKRAYDKMLNTDTAAEAATIFATDYERMGKAEANMPKRIAVAEQLAQQPAQQQQAPQPQQPPAPPVPQASPVNPDAIPGLAPVATPEGPKAPTPDIETLKGMRYNFVAGLQHLGANVAEGLDFPEAAKNWREHAKASEYNITPEMAAKAEAEGPLGYLESKVSQNLAQPMARMAGEYLPAMTPIGRIAKAATMLPAAKGEIEHFAEEQGVEIPGWQSAVAAAPLAALETMGLPTAKLVELLGEKVVAKIGANRAAELVKTYGVEVAKNMAVMEGMTGVKQAAIGENPLDQDHLGTLESAAWFAGPHTVVKGLKGRAPEEVKKGEVPPPSEEEIKTIPATERMKTEYGTPEENAAEELREEYVDNNWYHKKLNPNGKELPPPPPEITDAQQVTSTGTPLQEIIPEPIVRQSKKGKKAAEESAKEFNDLSFKESVAIDKELSSKFNLYDYLNETGTKSAGIQHVNASNAKTSLIEHAAQTKAVAALIDKLTKGKDFFALDDKTKKQVTYLQSLETESIKEKNRMDSAYGQHDWYKTLSDQINTAAKKTVTSGTKKGVKKVVEEEVAIEEPYVDAIKVEMYDKAIDKADEISLGDKKSSAKPLILKLIDQGLLTKEHLVNYENIFKDKDMGLEDIMSEVRADLEMGRETAASTPIDRPTKLLDLGESKKGKVEAPLEEEVAEEDLTQYERDQLQAQGFANKITDRKAEAARLENEKLAAEALARQDVRDRIAAKKLAGKTAPKGKKVITPEEVEYSNEIAEQGEQDYFSVSDKAEPTGHTAESLTKTLSPEMKRLVASGKAVIHDTAETLPEGKHPENVQGLTTPEGVAHFVADKLTPESIQNVALHEVGTHVGMENLVGSEVYKDITHQALNNEGPAFDKARASIPKDTPAHLRAHEALAYLVEHAPHLPVVKKLLSAVRNFARMHLGIKVKLTEADAKHLALKALRKESMTAQRTAREGTAYSTKAKPQSADWEQTVKEAKERTDEEGNVKPLTSSEKSKPWHEELHTKLKEGFDFFKPSKENASELRRVAVNSNDPVTRVLQKLDTISKPVKDAAGKVITKSRLRADLIKDQADQGLNFANNVAKLGAPHINDVGEAVIKDLVGVDGKAITIDSVLDRVAKLDKEKPGFLQVFSDVLRINIGEHRLKEHHIDKQIIKQTGKVTAANGKLSAAQTAQKAAVGPALIKAAADVKKAQDDLAIEENTLQKLEDNKVRLGELATEIPDLEKKVDALEKHIDAKGKATIKEQKALESLVKTLKDSKIEKAKLLGPERMVTDADIAWKEKVTKKTGKKVTRFEVVKDKNGKDVKQEVDVDGWENQDLQDALTDTKRVLDSIVEFEYQAGMYTEAQAKDFKDAPYAPLYKSMSDLEDIYGNKKDQGGKPMPMGNVKKIVHSEQTVNMAENLKRRVQRGVITGLINNAKREGVGQVRKVNENLAYPISRSRAERLTTVQRARALTLREGGRDKTYIIEDPHLLEILSFTRPLMHPVLNMLTTGTHLIRTTALQTPSFFLRQLPGEMASAVLLSGTEHGNILKPSNWLGSKVIGSMIKNMAYAMAPPLARKAAGKGNKTAAEILESHGLIVGIHDFVDQLSHSFEGLEKPKSLLDASRLPVIGKPLGAVGRGLKTVAGSIDAGVRAHVYEMAMLDAKENGLKGDAAETYAVNRARQFINFSASGSSDKVNLYRKAYLFSGASLNSLDALVKNATGYGLSKKEAAVAKKMFWTQTLTLGAMTMGYTAWSLMNNPEEYEKFIRDEANINRLLIPHVKTPDGTSIAPTIPFEAGFWGVTMPTLATISLFKALGHEVGLDWKDIMQRGWKQALTTITPPLPFDINEKGALRFHAPSGIAPVVETISGYSAYRGTNIESASQLNLPSELRESKSSPIANWFADAINSVSGERGTKISPAKVDYILRGYFSDYYGMANAVIHSATSEKGNIHKALGVVGIETPTKPENPKAIVEDYPILRSILTNPNKILEVGKAFDMAKELSSQKAALEYFKDRGDVEDLEGFLKSPYHVIAAGFADSMNKMKGKLGEMKATEELMGRQKTDAPQKKREFLEIKKGQQELVDTMITVYKEMNKAVAAEEAKRANPRK
jgi:hypothetical protein